MTSKINIQAVVNRAFYSLVLALITWGVSRIDDATRTMSGMRDVMAETNKQVAVVVVNLSHQNERMAKLEDRINRYEEMLWSMQDKSAKGNH